MNQILQTDHLLHGGDYNPEQWLEYPEILEQDIYYFKEAHINVVSLGIFSWSMLEPEERNFQFGWMEQIIERLYENGISVILATPSGAKPKWMTDKYPEILRVDETRHRNLYGERHNHCYTSPVYREKTRRINMELAKRFGNHPAVIAWHISNEYGGECHCELCQREFRAWLKQKYHTIDKLNHAWATAFWSHRYNAFYQIESPSSRGESSLHGLNLDWKRFVTNRTVDFARHEVKSLRDAGSQKPTLVNLMYDYRGLNYHKFADAVDIISWDNYPQWHKKEEKLTAMDSGMQHDIMRSIQKKPFLLMESCPAATNWQPVSKLKKPGMLHAASLQAIAHGSDSVQYFQLRQSRGSSEKLHGAVITHRMVSSDTEHMKKPRSYKEVTEVGESLLSLAEITGSTVKAKAAVLFDWENRWAMEDAQGPRNTGLYYKEAVEKPYYALRKQGLDVDVIDMEQELNSYQLVVAPMTYMFRSGFEQKVRAFVEKGGQFVLTYWSGIVDSSDLCFLGSTPHGLMDVFGLESTEIDALYDHEENTALPAIPNSLGLEKSWKCKNLCDLVELSTAEPLALYGEDFYQGLPAATVNSFGAGKAYYVCADFEQGFYDEFLKKIVKDAKIETIFAQVPDGVEVTTRYSETARYIFIQNFNRYSVAMALPTDKMQIIHGKYDGMIDSLETVILKDIFE